MFDENEEIKTLEQAKEFYIAKECNGFHMWHDCPQRYDEYKKLNISRETEKAWRLEENKKQYKIAKKSTGKEAYWAIYSFLNEAPLSFRNVKKIYKHILAKYKTFEPVQIVVLAEEICGYHTNIGKYCLSVAGKSRTLKYKYLLLIKEMCDFAVSVDSSLEERVKALFSPEWQKRKIEMLSEIVNSFEETLKKKTEQK